MGEDEGEEQWRRTEDSWWEGGRQRVAVSQARQTEEPENGEANHLREDRGQELQPGTEESDRIVAGCSNQAEERRIRWQEEDEEVVDCMEKKKKVGNQGPCQYSSSKQRGPSH